MNYTASAVLIAIGIAILFAPLMASAQSSQLRPFAVGISKNSVNISVSYQFFLSGDTQSVADQTALVDQGRRHLYILLAKECAVLLETIASDCTMNRANVSARIRQRQGRQYSKGVRVSGSATYKIKLKAKSTKTAE